MEALLDRGVKPFRLDTDRFPLSVQMAAHLDNRESSHRLKYGEHSIASEEIKAVWMRRIWQPQLGKELEPKFKNACVRESLAALDGFWDSLNVPWIDNLERISAAENKLYQLRIARFVGLTIPKTLVTNDPKQARDFFHQVGGNMVAKLLTPLSYSMKGSSFFLYTSKVKEEDLLEAQMLRYSPMVFQEEIPKDRELRVVYVDGKIFTGAIDASTYQTSTLDWRNATETCAWQKYSLPDRLVDRLVAFMQRFELSFGAFDFIQTPSGEYVFLELNPTGEWGMLEKDLEYPIASAIADALIAKMKK
ncbi:MAG: MvdC family ATP-grasp ribosomal peptide maturase [Xenococcaceae cyanobacterium]